MSEPHDETKARYEPFIAHLTRCQTSIYAYILTLVRDPDAAADLLQETNLVLWRKAEQFQPGTDFGAWAARIAHFEVLAWRKRHARDRHVFDDDLLQRVGDEYRRQNEPADLTDRAAALRRCIDRLQREERELIERRYAAGGSVKQIAADLGKSEGAVSTALYRLRHALSDCIERTIRSEDA